MIKITSFGIETKILITSLKGRGGGSERAQQMDGVGVHPV